MASVITETLRLSRPKCTAVAKGFFSAEAKEMSPKSPFISETVRDNVHGYHGSLTGSHR